MSMNDYLQTIGLCLPPTDLAIEPIRLFETLQSDSKEQSPDTNYTNFVTFHEKASTDVIPLKPKH